MTIHDSSLTNFVESCLAEHSNGAQCCVNRFKGKMIRLITTSSALQSFLYSTVNEWLKLTQICQSYRKNKSGNVVWTEAVDRFVTCWRLRCSSISTKSQWRKTSGVLILCSVSISQCRSLCILRSSCAMVASVSSSLRNLAKPTV